MAAYLSRNGAQLLELGKALPVLDRYPVEVSRNGAQLLELGKAAALLAQHG